MSHQLLLLHRESRRCRTTNLLKPDKLDRDVCFQGRRDMGRACRWWLQKPVDPTHAPSWEASHCWEESHVNEPPGERERVRVRVRLEPTKTCSLLPGLPGTQTLPSCCSSYSCTPTLTHPHTHTLTLAYCSCFAIYRKSTSLTRASQCCSTQPGLCGVRRRSGQGFRCDLLFARLEENFGTKPWVDGRSAEIQSPVSIVIGMAVYCCEQLRYNWNAYLRPRATILQPDSIRSTCNKV